MGILTTLVIVILVISFMTFVTFFGRLPALRFVDAVRLVDAQ
jgi:hypothetical protein